MRFYNLNRSVHSISECAHTLSTLLATSPSPNITHFGTNTVSWVSQISSHQQSTIINFTHLCSPSHHLHSDPIPPPEPLLHNHCAPLFLATPVKGEQAPVKVFITEGSNISSIVEPVSTVVEKQRLLVNKAFETPDQSVAVAPVVKGENEEEVKYQALITGSNVPTIAAESNFSVIENFSTLETHARSQTLVTTEEKYQEAKPHQDPPLIFLMLPQFAPFPKNWPSPPPHLDTISTTSLSDSRHCFDFYLFTPDLVRVSCPERFVSTNTVSSPGKTTVNTIAAVETEKMAGNTISATPPHHSSFVFDPGGTLPRRPLARHRRETRLCFGGGAPRNTPNGGTLFPPVITGGSGAHI